MNIDLTNSIINEKFPSIRRNKYEIINSIINKIKNSTVSIKINYYELQLVIDEAITNAMEHGNDWNPDKKVDVKITLYNESLSISIKDEGKGFDSTYYVEKNKNFVNLEPRGRGILIIKHFCNAMWNESGNQINLLIDIG